ncbi:hypothetical protein FGIG_12301 [Fasciola gigantica]|uniref:Uncharacterized protein n=1 Tax=Fasciola gigantica TaxID=46835 RepID=A0A504YFV4_FASGI|nr:hypothetical protein FGIG_12301 [Fasciola gigantica]
MFMNVHYLTRIVSDVRHHGGLDEFSALPFESHLYQIKTMIKGKRRITSQLFRCSESRTSAKWVILDDNPKLDMEKRKPILDSYTLTTTSPDNLVLVNGLPALIKFFEI